MANNTNRRIEVESTSDEGDHSNQEVEPISVEEEERHSWTWADQIRLVELVALHGKNWGSILNILHKEHRCADISDFAKLRVKFNSINAAASVFQRAFKKQKFTPPKENPETGQKLTKTELKVLQQNHDKSEERRQKEYTSTRQALKKIADDEIKASKGRGKKRTVEEVRQTLSTEEQERKDKARERIESARKEAERDRQQRDLLIKIMQASVSALERTNSLIERLQGDIYPTQPFVGNKRDDHDD